MSDEPSMAETEKFNESKLKKAKMQQKNPVPFKGTVEQKKRAGET
ncbi:thymosin beta-4-like [Rhinolophus sinicus]